MGSHPRNAMAGKWRLVGVDRPMLLCPEYDAQNSVRLEVAPGVRPVRVLLRQYGMPATVRLDGQEVLAEEPCATLPHGFNHLYRSSTIINLEPTVHCLELSGTVKDYPFMPSVFLEGEFAVYCDAPGMMKITPLPHEVQDGDLTTQGLRNYAGKVTLEQTVVVPLDAEWLCLDTGANCVAVTLDGRDLGLRCWAPFAWTVPAEVRGRTVVLSVTLESPVGWLFGRERLDGKAWQSPRDILPPGLYCVEWA